MSGKDIEAVTPQELLEDLKALDKEGGLKDRPEALLNEIIVNTSREYLNKKNRVDAQPINGVLAKRKSDSQILRENMIKAKRHFPPNTDAHHIVPSNETRKWAKASADRARAILNSWGIPINHEANGVALPSKSSLKVQDLPDAYPHKKVHTKMYYLNIVGHLAEAGDKNECLEILREIAEDLEDGIYPIRSLR